jgi:chromosome partition protein MukF
VLTSLAQRGVTLELSTTDICFVALLHVTAEGGALAAFSEERLIEIFEQVCAHVDPHADSPRKRATHAIRRLREQRLLSRVDGAGVLRAGDYALTRLATGIVDFFLRDDALTRESLTLLTRTLLVSLAEIREAARAANSAERWQTSVKGPLSVTVSELVSGIERRQRGLDLQQEQFQKDMAELLVADWFGAVDRCQTLLDGTSATLRELNEVLLRDAHQLQTLLQDIQELAIDASAHEAEQATHRVMEQVDRITAWGSARQRAWSEYYQYVHRYLRDVVRLDPARALTQRLRDQMTGKLGRSFSLTVANAPSIQLLRDVVAPPERPPVKRPRAPREKQLDDAAEVDAHALLEARVRDLLAEGLRSLSELTARVTAEMTGAERFVTAGRVAEVVAHLSRPHAERERPWLPIQEDIEIEEWRVGRESSDE